MHVGHQLVMLLLFVDYLGFNTLRACGPHCSPKAFIHFILL